MKKIKVFETYYDVATLYSEADKSRARRALFGYMLKTGRPDNPIFGGAFHLLVDLEGVSEHETYKLVIGSNRAREIIALAEAARAGAFDQFALSAREIKKTAAAFRRKDIQINWHE